MRCGSRVIPIYNLIQLKLKLYSSCNRHTYTPKCFDTQCEALGNKKITQRKRKFHKELQRKRMFLETGSLDNIFKPKDKRLTIKS